VSSKTADFNKSSAQKVREPAQLVAQRLHNERLKPPEKPLFLHLARQVH